MKRAFFLIGFLTIVAVFLLPPAGDTDLWFHLRTGQYIAEHRVVPTSDVFTYTAFGAPFVDHEWLAELIFYAMWRWFGFTGISWLVAIMGSVTLWLVAGMPRRVSWMSLAGVAAIMYCLQGFFVPRPQVFAYFALAATMLMLHGFFKNCRRRTLWPMFLTFLVWGNIHASVIVGAGIFLAAGGVELALALWRMRRAKADGRQHRRNAAALLGTALVGFAVSCINPFGIKVYAYAFASLQYSDIYATLIETQPFLQALGKHHIGIALVVHVLLICLFVWLIIRRRRCILPHEAILFPLFWALPFLAVKFLPFSWVVLWAIVLRVLNDHGILTYSWHRMATATTGVVVAVVVIAGASGVQISRDAHEEWPQKLVSFIVEQKLAGNIYNSYSWGGYLMWMMPDRPVFQYGGLSALYDGVYKDSLAFSQGERVDELIGNYQFAFALVRPWEPLAYSLSIRSDWALVYWDNFGMIYVRRDMGNDAVIVRYEIKIPYMNDTAEATIRKVGAQNIPTLLRHYKEALRRQPDLRLARFKLGLLEQLTGNCTDAVSQWHELIAQDETLGSAHLRLAQCYTVLGQEILAIHERELSEKYQDNQRWWFGGE